MIDIENEIYTAVEMAVKAVYPEVFMVGEYVLAPASFPCVSLAEVYNSVYRPSSTNEEIENHVILTYEANVYSNRTKGKKSQCKTIMSIIDEKLCEIGLTRNFLQAVPNILDSTVYRMYARYQCIADKNSVIYRR